MSASLPNLFPLLRSSFWLVGGVGVWCGRNQPAVGTGPAGREILAGCTALPRSCGEMAPPAAAVGGSGPHAEGDEQPPRVATKALIRLDLYVLLRTRALLPWSCVQWHLYIIGCGALIPLTFQALRHYPTSVMSPETILSVLAAHSPPLFDHLYV